MINRLRVRNLVRFAAVGACLALLCGALPAWAAPAGNAREQAAQGQNGAGQGASTTVQLPTFGISIDADGVLKLRSIADAGGQLRREREAAARAALPGDVAKPSKLRKVSLTRLERAIATRIADGRKPDAAMQNLAGLTRLEYVFCYPDRGEVVIAGPAEGWMADAAGRVVGIKSGQPVLQLVDLLVALRAYPPGRRDGKFVGCTIEPTPEGLERFQKFQQTIPRSVSNNERASVQQYVAQGTAESLGMAQIRVFGIPATTHFAQVLVEADYRMKLIGIGLEQPPVRIASFLDLARSPQQGMLQRWWFTPNYDGVVVTEDRHGMQLVGQGVQLQTENKVIGPNGKLLAAGQPNQASELFTAGFTAKYPELATRSPVYAQLRTLVDMLIAAAFIEREDFYGQAGWRAETFLQEELLPVETEHAMKQVPTAVNCVWRGSRMLAPAGGGVSILAHQALEPEHVQKDQGGKVGQASKNAEQVPNADAWCWD